MLTACERPISYNGEYEEPKLVVQALLNAGADSIVCIVERSYFFLESMNNTSNTLDNVTIDIASTFIDSLQVLRDVTNGNEHKLYLSHPLQANDTIRLIISHPELGIATAKEWITQNLRQKSNQLFGIPNTINAVLYLIFRMLILCQNYKSLCSVLPISPKQGL